MINQQVSENFFFGRKALVTGAAGGIGRVAWLASEVEFYALGILKEFGGFPDVIELDDGVEEIGGVFRAVDRFTPVDGSLFEMDSLGRQVPDKIAGRSQVANSVAEVRPQRYSCPGCHFKILLMQFSCRVWPDRGEQAQAVSWPGPPT